MEKTCLKTTLNAGIEGDLPVFNAVRIHAKTIGFNPSGATAEQIKYAKRLVFVSVSGFTISVIGDGSFDVYGADGNTVIASGVTTYTIAPNTTWRSIQVADGKEFDLLVVGEYGNSVFRVTTGSIGLSVFSIDDDLSKYNFLSEQVRVVAGNIAGKYTPYDVTNLEQLIIRSPNNARNEDAIVNLDDLTGSTKITIIDISRLTSAFGNIENLSGNLGITEMAVGRTNVSGDIETFAQAQVEAGRVSGTVEIGVLGTQITVGGISAEELVKAADPSGYRVWVDYTAQHTYNIRYTSA